MEKKFTNMAIPVFATVLYLASFVMGGYHNDRVLLTDVKTLTLKYGAMTNARRSSPVPQLKCVGGSAGCHSFIPQVVQCYNRGSDGYDVQWECKTDMDNDYRFGQVEVSCEGYDYPDDPYVLKGSCGLEYRLELTGSGHKNQGRQSNYHSSYNNNHYSHKKSSGLGDLVMLVGVGLVIYAIYKTCLSSDTNDRRQGAPYPQDNAYPGSHSPPPPGFRPEFTSGSDGCYSDQTYTNGMGGLGSGFGLGGNRGGGGGFWTGAATGGLLGYMFGGRNNGHTGYRSNYGSSWGNTGSMWGNSGSSSSSGWGSSSSGSRSASGFGGTKRR